MIFVDTNIVMYAVGRPHALRAEAQRFFAAAVDSGERLCTSAEVMQELAHVYIATSRLRTLDAAFELIGGVEIEVWPLEAADVVLARQLHAQHPNLQPRDLCHLASCRRRGVTSIKTFDRALAAVSDGPDDP